MEFKTIPSLDNKYEINEDGTIFRNVKTGRENKIKLDMHHSKKGYYTTFIHIGGRSPDVYCKRIMIHKAVAECWLGECPQGYEVDHKDRDSRNNHYSNLRYVTKSEQMKNRDHSNISKKGSQNLAEAREKRMIPIQLIKNNQELYFASESECARYISSISELNFEQARYRFKRRYDNIVGYKVNYLENILNDT